MLGKASTLAAIKWHEFDQDNDLFNAKNLHRYHYYIEKGTSLLNEIITNIDKPFSGIPSQALRDKLKNIDLSEHNTDIEQVINEIKTIYLNDTIYFHHPRYAAHLNCPIVLPALLGELITAAINTAVETWDQSIGASLIEEKMIAWTASQIGFSNQQADGVFTSGGSQSNLMGITLGRDIFCANYWPGHSIKHHGLPTDYQKLRIFTSSASHFTVKKSAAILGLGYQSVISVNCDTHFRMDIHDLTQKIQDCLSQGLIPMMVVATAGTTDFGSIDPLEDIHILCQDYGLWMHIDAAYGCGLLVSHQHRHLLSGIEHADSVTIDFHKAYFQPVCCSAFLVKEKKHLAVFTYHADYLNPKDQESDEMPNAVNKSMQTTRRFDALKLWLTLRIMGVSKIGDYFDYLIDLTKKAYDVLLDKTVFDVLTSPSLTTLVFRYLPHKYNDLDKVNTINVEIRKALFNSGEALIASTKIEGRVYLKLTLLNPSATIHDIQEIIELIKKEGELRYAHHTPSSHLTSLSKGVVV